MKKKQAGWLAEVSFAAEGSRLIVSELNVKPKTATAPAPPGGITIGLLRQALNVRPRVGRRTSRRVGELTVWRREDSKPGGRTRAVVDGLTVWTSIGINPETLEVLAAMSTRVGAGGRTPISKETLVSVASAYARAVEGGSTQPVVDAAKKLRMKPERVRDLVHRARNRGLLTRARWGRSGGELTTAAKRLIANRKKKGKKR